MGQLTLYLDQEFAEKVRQAANSEGVSQSQWVARLIEEKLATSWSEQVRQLAGAWPDLPEAEELRRSRGEDIAREPL
jgi:type II secretory pathway component PulK